MTVSDRFFISSGEENFFEFVGFHLFIKSLTCLNKQLFDFVSCRTYGFVGICWFPLNIYPTFEFVGLHWFIK